jgi:phage terminase large subunit-like protein
MVRKANDSGWRKSAPLPSSLAAASGRGEDYSQMTTQQLLELSQALLDRVEADARDWNLHARSDQVEPSDYLFWLVMAGRGWGKTRTGSETMKKWATGDVPGHYAVIAKNDREVRNVCFEAKRAGLLAVIPEDLYRSGHSNGYNKSSGDTKLTLTNGSIIRAFSAEIPDNIRGYAFDGAWCDEYAAWPKKVAQEMWDNLMFCMREAREPRVVITTTPKNVEHVRDMVARAQREAGWVITRGHTEDNRANLSPAMLAQLEHDYAGTRLGRQELGGELLEDVEHALWTLEMITAAQWPKDEPLPELVETVTSVDPSGSAKGDATGIVTMARARPPGFLADVVPMGAYREFPTGEGLIEAITDIDAAASIREQTDLVAAGEPLRPRTPEEVEQFAADVAAGRAEPMSAEEVLARAREAVRAMGRADNVRRLPVPGEAAETGPILVLADDTTQGTPEHRYSTACLAAHRHGSGVILVEGAYGGDNVMAAIRSSWTDLIRRGVIPQGTPMPRLISAPAQGTKADRAEPVVALYEQTVNGGARIYHAKPLPMLEDEQTTWEPDSTWSPNRIDAMVHGVRYLTKTVGYQGKVSSSTGLRAVGRRRIGGLRR